MSDDECPVLRAGVDAAAAALRQHARAEAGAATATRALLRKVFSGASPRAAAEAARAVAACEWECAFGAELPAGLAPALVGGLVCAAARSDGAAALDLAEALAHIVQDGGERQVADAPGALEALASALALGGGAAHICALALCEISEAGRAQQVVATPGALGNLVAALAAGGGVAVAAAAALGALAEAGAALQVAAAPGALAGLVAALAHGAGARIDLAHNSAAALAELAEGGAAEQVAAAPGALEALTAALALGDHVPCMAARCLRCIAREADADAAEGGAEGGGAEGGGAGGGAVVRTLLACLSRPGGAAEPAREVLRGVCGQAPDCAIAELEAGAAREAALRAEVEELRAIPVNTRAAIAELAGAAAGKRARQA